MRMKTSGKISIFYGVGAVIILIVVAYLIFCVPNKKVDDQVNITMAKTEYISNEKSRNVINNNNVMYPKYVKIANTDFPVVVEDGNYSDELINIALDDINLVYSQLKEYYIGHSTNKKSFLINGKNIQTNVSFNRGNQDLYGPRIFSESNFGYLLEVNGNHQLILSNSLMNEYEKALQFKESFEVEVSKLDAFLNRFNNDERFNDDEVPKLFFLSEHAKNFTIEVLRENADLLKNYYISPPSILEFSIQANGGNEVLICQTLLINDETNKVSNEIVLAFSDSEWRLVL